LQAFHLARQIPFVFLFGTGNSCIDGAPQRFSLPFEQLVNSSNGNTTLIGRCTDDWQKTGLIPPLDGFDRYAQCAGCFSCPLIDDVAPSLHRTW
jgi:hypothetical protein